MSACVHAPGFTENPPFACSGALPARARLQVNLTAFTQSITHANVRRKAVI